MLTVSAMSPIASGPDIENDYWRFTVASCSALLNPLFGFENVTVRSYGNVLACIAFLSGMAVEELSERELNVHDTALPLLITARAVKQ